MFKSFKIQIVFSFLIIVPAHSFAQPNSDLKPAIDKHIVPIKTLSFQAADLQGHWKSTTTTSEFTLSLNQVSNKLTGSHCSVQQSGNKVDCGLDESDVSISGIIDDSAIVTVEFKSFFGVSVGKATIQKLTSNTVEWNIIQKPHGEFYIPMKAVLTKQKN